MITTNYPSVRHILIALLIAIRNFPRDNRLLFLQLGDQIVQLPFGKHSNKVSLFDPKIDL